MSSSSKIEPSNPAREEPVCEKCGSREGLVQARWMEGLYFCRTCWQERGKVNRAFRAGYEDELSEE